MQNKNMDNTIKVNDIVQFLWWESPLDSTLQMRVLEDNGNRVLIVSLLGWEYNPIHVYLKNDLVKVL